MAESYLERERKFDVPADFALPAAWRSAGEDLELVATYFDTDDDLLQLRGVTLRHRVGGTDDGWHLKLPHPDGKLELHAVGSSDEPPEELTALVRGLSMERALHRRAVLRTRRRPCEIHTADGRLEAEVTDDRVSADIGQGRGTIDWREVEVELGHAADEKTMERISAEVTAAGATVSAARSKYARAVGEPRRPELPGLAGLVDRYLQTQYERLTWGDLRMRREENAVHKTRVAVRRTRSTLRTFAPLFDHQAATALDTELKWYAEALGAVRDLDVFGRHLDDDLHHSDGVLLTNQGVDGLRDRLRDARDIRWRELRTLLDGDRYGNLLRALDDWRRGPPFTPAAEDDEDRARRYLKRARKKSDKRLRQAGSADAAIRDDAFHRARKAAKRTRYAAELARPALGKRAKNIAKTHEERQDDLGQIQDHRMMISLLRDLTQNASGAVAFTSGLLAQRHFDAKQNHYRSRCREV